MIFQSFFSFFSERVSIIETRFSALKETEKMKTNNGVLEGIQLAANPANAMLQDKPNGGESQAMPDGLGGNG